MKKPTGRRSNIKRKGRQSKYTKGGSGQIQALRTLTVPDKLIVKLPYYEEFVMNSNTNYTYNYWRLNSIYDPNGTGVGHQPLGYDQWSAFYGRYRVIGAQFRITIVNTGTTPTKISLASVNGVYSGASDESSMEQPHTIQKTVGGNGGKDVIEFKKFFTNSRVTGVSPTTYKADDRYQSLFGQNPLEQMSAVIQARTLGAGSVVNLISGTVHITYLVELFDRNMLSLSNTAPENRQGDEGPTADN